MSLEGWHAGPFESKGFCGQEAWFSSELLLKYDDGTTETEAVFRAMETVGRPLTE